MRPKRNKTESITTMIVNSERITRIDKQTEKKNTRKEKFLITIGLKLGLHNRGFTIEIRNPT